MRPPKVGDTITYTTVSSKNGLEGYVNRLTERFMPACLEFRAGLGKDFETDGRASQVWEVS